MKIAIVLLRTLGDVIIGNRIVDRARQEYPDAEIHYFVDEKYKSIIRNNPHLDYVICPKSWDEVLFRISDSQWDKVLLPHQTSRVDNMWHHNPVHKNQHLYDFYMDRCGFKEWGRKLVFYPDTTEQVWSIPGEYIVLHSTTLVPSKNWDKFNSLVPYLQTDTCQVIQVGLPSDITIEGAKNYRGNHSITQIYEILRGAKAFIGLDSGLSYLAAAAGTKTICIMGPTIPKTSAPFGDNVKHVVAHTRPECQEQRCHGNCRFGQSCINAVSIEGVLEAL